MTILSRLAKFGASTTAALLTCGVFFRDDVENPIFEQAHSASSSTPFFESETFPHCQWNSNWDNGLDEFSRDPLYLIDEAKYEAADTKTRKEMLQKATTTATRNIILIRHGQYVLDKDEKILTELGREQALLLGKRLSESGLKFDVLVMSPMKRASETAALILNQMLPIPTKVDSILEEGAPYPPEPPVPQWRPKQRKFFAEGPRIEAAFRKYIHRASPEQKEDSYEIIVCHGNVIRYFVCRALQFPPEGWLRMSLGNCSVTWLVIRPNGYVSLRSLGDIGHLPKDKITFT